MVSCTTMMTVMTKKKFGETYGCCGEGRMFNKSWMKKNIVDYDDQLQKQVIYHADYTRN